MLQQFSKWHTQPVVSAAYTRPIYACLSQQLGLGLLCGLMLDHGYAAYLCGAAVAMTWALNGIILLRRPQNPTETDLQLIRWSFLPLFIFVVAVNFILKR